MKFKKKGLALSVMMSAGLLLAACGGDKEPEAEKPVDEGTATDTPSNEVLSVAMVTDTGGVDDKSFNQSAWKGITEYGEANGLERGDGGYDYLPSTKEADFKPNLNNLVRRDFDIVFGIGYLMDDAIKEIASQKPDTNFVIVDSEVEGDNVASVMFKEQEGAFLAGVAAALTTETDKIGFVGGMDIPVIKRFEAGFIEGVKAINPDIKVDVQYVASFTDAALGKGAASRMYASGADIVFHAAGGAGVGVFAEAKELKKASPDKNFWVIGVDSDQYEEGKVDENTNVTLTSMLKRVDVAVTDITERANKGEFPGGETLVYGLEDEGVILADSRGAISEEILAKVAEFEAKIASGEIEVPEEPVK